MEYRMIGVVMGVLIALTIAVAVAFLVYKVVMKLLKKHGKDWAIFKDEKGTGTEMGI